MVIKRFLLLSKGAVVLLFCVTTIAQNSGANEEPTISIGPNVLVSSDAPLKPHAESFIALNPKDPTRMLATSIVFDKGMDTTAAYISSNGGRRWQRSASFAPDVPPFSGGDPIVYFDNTGGALFGSIASMPVGFRVWRSSNGGLKWDSITSIPGGIYDRQYLVVDRTSGPYAGHVYSGGIITIRKSDGGAYPAVATSYSIDHGKTFAPSVIVDTTSGGQKFGGSVSDLLVTKKGVLVVIFSVSDRVGVQTANPVKRYWTIISEDGGRSFSTARPGLEVGRDSAPRSLKTHFAPHATIDQSDGPFTGRIYLLWIDYGQNRYDLKVAHSDDLGLTWSAPVTINDNLGPDDPSNPAIAVNRNGVLAVIWNDRREDPQNQCYRLYVSASLDGGDTFLPNKQVNANPTCPNAEGNWPGRILSFVRTTRDGTGRYRVIDILGVPERFQNGGETQGLVAGPDGRFHVAWINGQTGVMQLWYTSFSIDAQTVGVHRIDRTRDINVEVNEPVIDFAAKSLTFTVTLKNQSSASIPGPLTLVLHQIQSGLGGLVAVNSDNGLPGRNAAWVFSLNTRHALAPGEVSETRQLRWQFDGKIPNEPKDRFRGDFLVFGEAAKVISAKKPAK